MLSHFNSRFHQLRRVCQEVRTRVPPAAARHPAASHVEGRQGQDSVVFAQSSGTDISDVRMHDVFNLGSEFFIIDLSYSVNTYSASGVSVSDTDMYLVVYRDEEVLYAYTVFYY